MRNLSTKTKKTKNKIPEIFKLPPALSDLLQSEKEKTGLTKTAIVERALAAYLSSKDTRVKAA